MGIVYEAPRGAAGLARADPAGSQGPAKGASWDLPSGLQELAYRACRNSPNGLPGALEFGFQPYPGQCDGVASLAMSQPDANPRSAGAPKGTSSRDYDAILLDLDGTLVTSAGEIHPATLAALHAAHERGVHVMVATGRSKIATLPVLEELGLPTPAAIFNGAAIYCPSEQRMLEERLLSQRLLDQFWEYIDHTQDLAILMCAHEKFSRTPRSEAERTAIAGLHAIQEIPVEQLTQVENVLRVTLLSDRFEDSHGLHEELSQAVAGPSYRTHFSLSLLPRYHGSPYQVADLHAPCLGKAEALRFLQEQHGIPASRVVAVGDAYNDVEMVEAAGLGVCMENGVGGLKRRADRIIGDNEGPAIGDLVSELFLS